MRMLRAQTATQLYASLHGRAVAEGSADVEVRLWPLEHPDGGTRFGLGVDVRTTEGRPLRAPASVHPSQIEILADRSRVVALVVLEPDGAAAHAEAIGAAIADHVPGIGRVAATRYPLPAGRSGDGLAAFLQMAGRPRTSTGHAMGFLGGRRYRELIRAWGESASLVDAVWLADAEVLPDFGSLAFGAGIIPSPGAVPAVALGVAGSPDDLSAMETALVPVIDAAGGSLIQALVTRWGTSPAVDQTAYELACGVHGQCTLERRWVERWLRGVGPGWLWLGPALREAVGADALSGLTTVEVGASLRIQVRDVAAVEAALAELLPSAADWQEGMRLRFGG